MRRAGIVALAFVALAIAEIAVFVAMVKLIGLAWTLLLVIVTSVAGGWLLGREGGRGWRRFRAALVEGRPPGRAATDGLLGLVGALLLVLPGFLTAVTGPPPRQRRDHRDRGGDHRARPEQPRPEQPRPGQLPISATKPPRNPAGRLPCLCLARAGQAERPRRFLTSSRRSARMSSSSAIERRSSNMSQ